MFIFPIMTCLCKFEYLHVCVCLCVGVHMLACVCVCVWTCLHVCGCACACMCVSTCLHACVCVYACMCARMHGCVYVRACVLTCLHVCACECVCMCVCVWKSTNKNNKPTMCNCTKLFFLFTLYICSKTLFISVRLSKHIYTQSKSELQQEMTFAVITMDAQKQMY